MVVSLTRGDTLYAENAGEEMQPASTMKLFTSAIALERFGPNYQFSTDVLRDGPVGPDGTLNGNIYIRGDGDPALSGKFLPGGPSAPMNRLADLVAQQGIKHVTGSVVGDASGFDDQKIPEGWRTRYLQASYAARVSALSLNENLIVVSVSPSAPGKPATVVLEPSTSAIPLVANVRTVAGGGARLGFRHPQIRLHRRGSRELCNGCFQKRADRARHPRRRWHPTRQGSTECRKGREPSLASPRHHGRRNESGEHQSLC